MAEIILASTSTSRKKILESLRLEFQALTPSFEEHPLPRIPPERIAIINGEGKALSVVDRVPAGAFIIGSDQVASNHEGQIFHKSVSLTSARAQLAAISGEWLHFTTSLIIVRDGETLFRHLERFSVRFRTLSKAAIDAYVMAEQPIGCAGSFMAEAAGWRLIQDTQGSDVRALYGLPVLALFDFLDSQNVELPYVC